MSSPLDFLKGSVLPGMLMFTSSIFFIQTAIASPTLLFTNFTAYRDKAFGKWWIFVAKIAADDTPESLNEHIAKAQGVILDLGPGSGTQLFRFKNVADKISAIYLVEPNEGMHASLAKKAEEAGLGGKYTILTCGGEPESLIPALQKANLLGDVKDGASGEPIFDDITCVLVLCGVPEPKATINGLYKLLKPGGRFILCEHVVAETGFARLLQRWYHLIGWQTLIGGCNMDRDTGKWIQDAAQEDGGWAEVNFEPSTRDVPLGYVVGSLVKRSKL